MQKVCPQTKNTKKETMGRGKRLGVGGCTEELGRVPKRDVGEI